MRHSRSDEGAEVHAVGPEPLKKLATITLTLAVVAGISVLLVTDVRGRAEVRSTTGALASTHSRLEQEQAHLHSTQAQMRTALSQAWALEASISETQTSLAASNAAISAVDRGLVFDGFDISALNTCLSGVTQALDQVAVGQTSGALVVPRGSFDELQRSQTCHKVEATVHDHSTRLTSRSWRHWFIR